MAEMMEIMEESQAPQPAMPQAPKRKVPSRPRDIRYIGRKSREVLLTDEKDEWVSKQMGARWSRNQVIDHCIGIAMHKVEVAAENENAVAVSLDTLHGTVTELTGMVEGLAHQLRTVLAMLNVDAVVRYPSPNFRAPASFREYQGLVKEALQSQGQGRKKTEEDR